MLHAALDSTPLFVSLITTTGVVVVGWFGYLGLKASANKASEAVITKVSELDSLNTAQHGQNAELLKKMLDTITEHGVIMASVVDVQNYPIIKTDSAGSLIQINAAGVRLIGMSPSQLSGTGWIEAIHPEDKVKVFEEWTQCVKEQRIFGPTSYRYVHPTSKVITLVEAIATPVISKMSGEVLSWISVVVPISDLGVPERKERVSHG